MNIFKKIFSCKPNHVVESYINNQLDLSKYYVGGNNLFVVRFPESLKCIYEWNVLSAEIPKYLLDGFDVPKFKNFNIVISANVSNIPDVRRTLYKLIKEQEKFDLTYEFLDKDGKIYDTITITNCCVGMIEESKLDYDDNSIRTLTMTFTNGKVVLDK